MELKIKGIVTKAGRNEKYGGSFAQISFLVDGGTAEVLLTNREGEYDLSKLPLMQPKTFTIQALPYVAKWANKISAKSVKVSE